jgi:hypothetical protein
MRHVGVLDGFAFAVRRLIAGRQADDVLERIASLLGRLFYSLLLDIDFVANAGA